MEKDFSINVAFAEDHEIVRKGVIEIMEGFGCIRMVIAACDGKDLISQLEKTRELIDIVIMDISMPKLDGYEAVKIIKENWPDRKILILTMHKHELYVKRMLGLGVNGYLLKNCNPRELKKALIEIYETGHYYSDVAPLHYFNKIKNGEINLPHFTDHETDFLKLCPTDLSLGEIADKLDTTTDAVEGCRDRLCKKLSLHTRTGLAVYAIEHGFFQVDPPVKPDSVFPKKDPPAKRRRIFPNKKKKK